MNRDEYISELQKRLAGLSEAEIADAIAYCEEYFNEAQDEETATQELGSPAKFAAQLKAEAVIKETHSDTDSKASSPIKKLLWLLAGIFALPIALPLLLTACIMVFVCVVLLFVSALVGIILFVTCIYAGITSLITAFMYISVPADMMMHIGITFICIGVAWLSFSILLLIMNRAMPYLIRKSSDFYHRHKGERTYETA